MNHILTLRQRVVKRTFDLLLALILLALFGWIIVLAWIAASIDTRSNGMFCQTRIGRWGKPFTIFKIKTMRPVPGITTTVTAGNDVRITKLGRWLRRLKIDELPQLVNVLVGNMSFVGPRPDVPGFADFLEGEDRVILSIRPGITGPATLAFRDEEILLQQQDSPDAYNKQIIWPQKIKLNTAYLYTHSLTCDICIILNTLKTNKLPDITHPA